VDYEQLAKAIVAGTEVPDSGWYNSPDDLVDVIRKALECACRTGAEDAAHARESKVEHRTGAIAARGKVLSGSTADPEGDQQYR
jgi:hypothetical protein